MAVTDDFLLYIKDQLTEFGPYTPKKMFGGVGFFRDEAMFGLIKNETFMLRADEQTVANYAGMKQFAVEMKGGKEATMPYYEVPPNVLEDRTKLAQWAALAFEVALVAKQAKKKK